MEQATRPVPLHLETHPEPVSGCFGCKVIGIKFSGLSRLKKMREDGSTEESIKQEIYSNARRTGRDIQRAR
jgi:hypothetical protein